MMESKYQFRMSWIYFQIFKRKITSIYKRTRISIQFRSPKLAIWWWFKYLGPKHFESTFKYLKKKTHNINKAGRTQTSIYTSENKSDPFITLLHGSIVLVSLLYILCETSNFIFLLKYNFKPYTSIKIWSSSWVNER